MIVPAIAAAFLTAASVSADAASRSVSISAKATGITENAPVEFLLVGPDSDRDYESVFVTELSADEIAKAFEKAGSPRGTSINERACRFWPAGCRVSVEPSPWNYVSDCEGPDGLLPVTYTGGERDAYGTPAAATNMPPPFLHSTVWRSPCFCWMTRSTSRRLTDVSKPGERWRRGRVSCSPSHGTASRGQDRSLSI